MKTKIFGNNAILLLTAIIAFNTNLNLDKKGNTQLLALDNVEALAWEWFPYLLCPCTPQ